MEEKSQNPVKLDAAEPEAQAPPAPAAAPGGPGPEPGFEDRVVRTLKTIYDPEIPVDIYELGLIYDIDVQRLDTGERAVHVKMTLTSPACPVAGSLPGEVEQKVAGIEGVDRAEVEIVWDPAWNPSMMSEVAKLELGFF